MGNSSPVGGSAFESGMRFVERNGALEAPTEFELSGLQWDLLPEVFGPVHTDSTALFSEWLPYPVGGRFLEVGCGAGVTTVLAVLRGCASVTAVDITSAAVRNTAMNAARHGVADRVRLFRSDLFDALPPGERFDLVYWNSNVVPAPEDFTYTRPLQWAIFDRGYLAHRRYLREGTTRVTDGGRLFLGFNSLGDRGRLDTLAAELGRRILERESATRRAADVPVEFQLLEIIDNAEAS